MMTKGLFASKVLTNRMKIWVGTRCNSEGRAINDIRRPCQSIITWTGTSERGVTSVKLDSSHFSFFLVSFFFKTSQTGFLLEDFILSTLISYRMFDSLPVMWIFSSCCLRDVSLVLDRTKMVSTNSLSIDSLSHCGGRNDNSIKAGLKDESEIKQNVTDE